MGGIGNTFACGSCFLSLGLLSSFCLLLNLALLCALWLQTQGIVLVFRNGFGWDLLNSDLLGSFAIRASLLLILGIVFGSLDLVLAILFPLHNLIVGRAASGEMTINMTFLAFEGQLFIVQFLHVRPASDLYYDGLW